MDPHFSNNNFVYGTTHDTRHKPKYKVQTIFKVHILFCD